MNIVKIQHADGSIEMINQDEKMREDFINRYDYAVDRFETLCGGTPISGGQMLDAIRFHCKVNHMQLPFILRTLPIEKVSDAMLGEMLAYLDFLKIIQIVYGDDVDGFLKKLIEKQEEHCDDVWKITDSLQLYFGKETYNDDAVVMKVGKCICCEEDGLALNKVGLCADCHELLRTKKKKR